ncbi:hypothetical protein LMH87_004523 [Akanthomyces muscarius]|uniref:serine--tRNA ligase n=1 Tax=Akanthomyces muscarius TaxID=2231603 RepID=A0A9W8Q402_AKAMU|nr:hypothetical protein LMH87_004523 [Akanthomyces muscarius]KAJ4145684.1 hypothetical protein LMH87_004523 [Akanthomyces muscarius]
MLDVNDFIVERGGNPDRIRESQRRRFADEGIVDQVIALFEDHRKTQYSASQISSKINEVQKLIGAKKKAKEDANDLLQQKVELEKEKKLTVESATQKEKILRAKIKSVGNIVDDSVPVSNNEDDNAVQRTWAPEGVAVEKRNVLSHHEVLLRLDGYDPDRGVKVVGHRGYFLRQWGVFLNQALINYGLEFLSQREYCPLQAPQFMLRDYMAKTAQLDDFDEQLYKVVDGDEANDKYLIATSEQPISAFHADEWLIAKDLPIKYAGYSTCYRREAGSHGRDAWGIYRVHQFEKVEQFVLTDPEKSWEAFEEMISVSEDFYQSLGLPYQVIAIVSGALNNAAAKKFDLEAWFPHQGEYKELVSCSNCTDYQSRALDIRFGAKTQTDTKKKYVHCLNSTLCATTRTLCCVLENYQTEEGLRVPEPLRKYLPGAPEFIPFAPDQPRLPVVFWNRFTVRARLKLKRLNGHHGPTQDRNREDLELRLGKFAHEDQMPSWLRHYLLSHDDNSKDGVIRMLHDILNGDSQTISAYLAHPAVNRITKLRHEGSFCGYRNIQMLISYLILATETGPRAFPGGVPNIFQLQDQIEDAWDNGCNSRGRNETGGIKGTRKFIGTQEAQALFFNMKIKCSARRFQDSKERSALDQVLDDIISYFQRPLPSLEVGSIKVRSTMLPPIYFQRPGHSFTVIGLEKTVHNEWHLLVFNPGNRYRDTTHHFPSVSPRRKQDTLEPYRLRPESLRKYSEFELLYLT